MSLPTLVAQWACHSGPTSGQTEEIVGCTFFNWETMFALLLLAIAKAVIVYIPA